MFFLLYVNKHFYYFVCQKSFDSLYQSSDAMMHLSVFQAPSAA